MRTSQTSGQSTPSTCHTPTMPFPPSPAFSMPKSTGVVSSRQQPPPNAQMPMMAQQQRMPITSKAVPPPPVPSATTTMAAASSHQTPPIGRLKATSTLDNVFVFKPAAQQQPVVQRRKSKSPVKKPQQPELEWVVSVHWSWGQLADQ